MLWVVLIKYKDSNNVGICFVPADSEIEALAKVKLRRGDFLDLDAEYQCWGVVGNIPMVTDTTTTPMVSFSDYLTGKLR